MSRALFLSAEFLLRHFAYLTTAFSLIFSAASLAAARAFYRGRRVPLGNSPLPPITVLKPIKGIDRQMFENLASFLSQDYPRFQTLFAVQDSDDPALKVLESLRKDYPDAEIVVSQGRVGPNPKINNLSNAYPRAQHDILVISDSDVRANPGLLRRIAAPFADPKTGMVTCFYRAQLGRGLGGLLETLSVNAQFLPQTLLAGRLLGMRFAMGAVMAVRRSVFEECGGFARLSHYLADDFILGRLVLNAGKDIVISGEMVDCVPSISSLREHWAHISRWCRTIRVCQPGGYAGLAATHAFAWQTLYLALFGPSPIMLSLWLATAVSRILAFVWMHRLYLETEGAWRQAWLVPLSDLIQFAAWTAGFASPTILWRGERYDTAADGRLLPRNPEAEAPGKPLALAS